MASSWSLIRETGNVFQKKKKENLFVHFTKRHTVKRGLEFLCGPVAKPMRRKSQRVFIALVFRVDDAKINCSLEKCFRIGLKRSRTGNETIRNTLLYIVFPDG